MLVIIQKQHIKTKVKNDNSLLKVVTKVTQEGKNLRQTVTYEDVYHNGKLVLKVAKKK